MRRSQVGKRVSVALESVALGEVVSVEGFLGDLLGKMKGLFSKPSNFKQLKKLVEDKNPKLKEISDEIKRTVLSESWMEKVELVDEIELSAEILQHISFKGRVDDDVTKTVSDGLSSAKRYFNAYQKKIEHYTNGIQSLVEAFVSKSSNLRGDELEGPVKKLYEDVLKLQQPSSGMSYPVHLPGSATLTIDKPADRVNDLLNTVGLKVDKAVGPNKITTSKEMLRSLGEMVIEAIELGMVADRVYDVGIWHDEIPQEIYDDFLSTEYGDEFWDIVYEQNAWDYWTEGVYEYGQFVTALIKLVSKMVK